MSGIQWDRPDWGGHIYLSAAVPDRHTSEPEQEASR